MDASSRAISPLRQRMIDDMRMCKLSPKTQLQYIRAVKKLTGFVSRSPDTVTVEDLRRYQLHLVDHGTSPVSINAAITGLKFFFDVTLDRRELITKMRPVRVPRKLPVVLSRDEVARLIAATGNLKHQTALSAAYGAGLRASEVVALKVTDIDSHRMTLRIEQGKGSKDRYAMLPPILLERLRGWWRVARAQGKMLEGGWLFPGQNPIESLTCRQLNRAVHAAAQAANIDKRVSMAHATAQLRHPPSGAEGRHPCHSGAAWAQEARDHRSLYPGSHRRAARSDQSAGAFVDGVAGADGASRPGGRGHLPRPRLGLAANATGSPESWTAQGDVRHRTVPQRGAGRPCSALRSL